MSLVRSVIVTAACAVIVLAATPVLAQEVPQPIGVEAPDVVDQVGVPEPAEVGITISSDDPGLSQTVVILLLLTAGSVLPSLLVLMTSFTRFVIVLGLTRNAIGIQTVPPAPVIIGLSLFLTLFVMAPVFSQVNDTAIQPFLEGELETTEAIEAGYQPMREFMLSQTREGDIRLFLDLSEGPKPETPQELSATVLVPAYIVSELRTAFIIGFVVFVPFLVIDLVVATILMSLGMVMLPPVFISLPLKLLMFVLVDGWVLIIGSLVASVTGGAG